MTVKETMVAVPMDQPPQRSRGGSGAADDKSLPLPDAAASEEEPPQPDPWALPELTDQGVKWAGKPTHKYLPVVPLIMFMHINLTFHIIIIHLFCKSHT